MYNFIFYWWDSKMFLFFRTTFVTKSNFWLFFEQLFEKLQETFWKISSNLWKALGVANQNAVFASSCPLVDATIQHCTIKKLCNLENICKHMAIETTANDKQQNWVPGIWDLTKKKQHTHTNTHTHTHMRDSGSVNGIRYLTPTREAGFAKIWAWDGELGKKPICGIAVTEVWDVGVPWKRGGNAGSAPSQFSNPMRGG